MRTHLLHFLFGLFTAQSCGNTQVSFITIVLFLLYNTIYLY